MIRRRRQLAAGAAALCVVALALLINGLSGGGLPRLPAPGLAGPGAAEALGVYDYVAAHRAAYVARATAGNAQVLYTMSPGGVFATAARVARYRRLIDATVRGTGIPPAMLEALVFVESAGRPEVIAGTSAADAAGLTQILAGTGRTLLGMRIDLGRSQRLTRRIELALAAGKVHLALALERRRAAIDERFDPASELRATVRYLQIAEAHLGGRLDLAVAAYHAGIGNMQQVLDDYDGGTAVDYARLYFDVSPIRHPAAYDLLYSLGDDSSLYLWRVLAAEQIMTLYRSDRAALARLNALETAYPSDAVVLVPPTAYPGFADPDALASAYERGAVVPLPRNAGALHLDYASSIGSSARRLGVSSAVYRGLRPAALRVLISIAAEVHVLDASATPLVVTGAVIDRRYEAAIGAVDAPASTGFTFSIERRYASPAEAAAFQFVLDRLQSLNLIAWFRTPMTIEITVAPDARAALAHGL